MVRKMDMRCGYLLRIDGAARAVQVDALHLLHTHMMRPCRRLLPITGEPIMGDPNIACCWAWVWACCCSGLRPDIDSGKCGWGNPMLGDARKDMCGGIESALPGAPFRSICSVCGMSRESETARC